MPECRYCKTTRPLTEFYKNNKNPGGLSYMCRPCTLEWQRNHRKARPYYARAIKFRVSEENIEALVQSRQCEICKTPDTQVRHVIDHNHKTLKIRGYLCDLCNKGLGQFRDSPDLLEEAANYLRKYN